MKKGYLEKYHEGMILESNSCGPFKILHLNSYYDVMIEFQDDYRCKIWVGVDQIDARTVTNPYAKSLCGVAYMGEGDRSRLPKNCMKTWVAVVQRCYGPERESYKSYKDVSMTDEWLCFQNFASWFVKAIYFKGWVIDKDIIIPGNRVYGPDTCVFVPAKVNSFFTQRPHAKTPTGFAGIDWHKRDRLYIASGPKKGFKSIEDAVTAQKIHRENLAKSLAEMYPGMDNRVIEKLNTFNYLTYRNT